MEEEKVDTSLEYSSRDDSNNADTWDFKFHDPKFDQQDAKSTAILDTTEIERRMEQHI